MTSKVNNLSEDEFRLENWKDAGLNVPTAIKRGCILVDASLVIKKVGALSEDDLETPPPSENISPEEPGLQDKK